jgi:hypothetical protein
MVSELQHLGISGNAMVKVSSICNGIISLSVEYSVVPEN